LARATSSASASHASIGIFSSQASINPSQLAGVPRPLRRDDADLGYGVRARVNLRDPNLSEKLRQGPELSRGFMISFNLYRHYFPMIALARRVVR
jgi:hypothetical protein